MTLYVDSSALLKRYVEEPDSDRADALLCSDDDLVTGRHTVVEVRRNLARLLEGLPRAAAQRSFLSDLEAISLIELDAATCELAATVAETTGARTLDSLHLGAALRVGADALGFATFDLRQAQVARSLGFSVLGV
jgi:hypothetical protein